MAGNNINWTEFWVKYNRWEKSKKRKIQIGTLSPREANKKAREKIEQLVGDQLKQYPKGSKE